MPLNLQAIGKSLKERREEKGLTIRDVSDTLCLRKTLVQAIEDGDWNMLPHEVYVRGYLKEYLHLLDMPQDILGLEEPPEEKPAFSTEPAIPSKISEKRHVPRRAIVVPLIFILIISFFVLNQIYKNRSAARSTANQISHSEGITTKKASVNVGQATTANTPQTSGDQSQQAGLNMSDKKLMITCNERTWISVVIDDNEKKEFMLNPQEMIIVNGKENFDLLIGNAAGVKLNLNGKEIGLTGQSGEVKRIKVS